MDIDFIMNYLFLTLLGYLAHNPLMFAGIVTSLLILYKKNVKSY